MSTEIGALVVDLTLKSADFIRDLNKTAGEVSRTQGQISKSLNTLTTAFGAFLTARTLRQFERITEQSLELAASMHGALADSAEKFLGQFANLQDAFQVGLATGFLENLNTGLLDSADNIKTVTEAANALGTVESGVWNSLAGFFLHDLPDGLKQSGQQLDALGGLIWDIGHVDLPPWLTWIDSLNAGIDSFLEKYGKAAFAHNPLAGMTPEGGGTLYPWSGPGADYPKSKPPTPSDDDTAAVLAYGKAWELAALETTEFWKATVSTTAAGQALLEQSQAYVNFVDQAGTPMEQYRLALERINATELDGADKAKLIGQAQADLANKWLDAAGAVTGALASIFEKNKAFAIANAVVNTAEAITSALKNPPGPPFSYVYAAAAAAAGAAQIAAITSARPGSTKTPSAPTGAGATAASTAAASQGNAHPRGGQALTVVLQGTGGFSRDQLRGLVDQINDLGDDGIFITVRG